MRPERFDFREDDRIDKPKLKAPLREVIASTHDAARAEEQTLAHLNAGSGVQ
jgi:hypothetical protein